MTAKRRVLTVVMDGVGICDTDYGNAVRLARTPNLEELQRQGLFLSLRAHGKAVGLPSDMDIGNSEVGHNALGAGRVFDQGAKLVQNAVDSGDLFRGETWGRLVSFLKDSGGTLHLLGLLSDGNVHSHQDHLHALIKGAKESGLKQVRIHALLDGRDVPEKSALVYIDRLLSFLSEMNDDSFHAAIASGGGRMRVTMDRYDADWSMVERGWRAQVDGVAEHVFPDFRTAVETFYKDPDLTDQYLPAFVIGDAKKGSTRIRSGDSVVLFNFRGDRAIEVSRAFTEGDSFDEFDRGNPPDVFFAGMMQYDGDLQIPKNYLVSPPEISQTLGEHLADLGCQQFACSETQKYGHVTFFWNGNRSGKFSDKTENYLEIPSDNVDFDLRPWMKAEEITQATIKAMQHGSFDHGRINYANGDMVGHTGNLDAAIVAVATVDLMIGRLMRACLDTETILMVTADHGNCDEMFQSAEQKANWQKLPVADLPAPKTSHTLNPVPFYLWDPKHNGGYKSRAIKEPGLANVANTILQTLGLKEQSGYEPGLLDIK